MKWIKSKERKKKNVKKKVSTMISSFQCFDTYFIICCRCSRKNNIRFWHFSWLETRTNGDNKTIFHFKTESIRLRQTQGILLTVAIVNKNSNLFSLSFLCAVYLLLNHFVPLWNVSIRFQMTAIEFVKYWNEKKTPTTDLFVSWWPLIVCRAQHT